MATINDLIDDVTTESQAYYEEPDESEIPEGTYQGKIVALTKKMNKRTKRGDRCDIFWLRYQINEDSPESPGKLVRDSGLFRFRGSVGERNIYYKQALDKLEIPLEKKSINGKIRYLLPSLSIDMVMGKEVLINIYYDEWQDRRGHHKIPVAKIVKLVKEKDDK